MSIVTNLLGKLHFSDAMRFQVVSLGSRLPKISIRTTRFRFHRDWSSRMERRNFETARLARSAYVETNGRIPVAR
jgi:hypothetical protein